MESKNQSKRDTTKTMPMVSQNLDCAMILGARSLMSRNTEETRLLLTTFASDLMGIAGFSGVEPLCYAPKIYTGAE